MFRPEASPNVCCSQGAITTMPIKPITTDGKAARQLNLAYGVKPMLAPFTNDIARMREQSIDLSFRSGIVKEGDLAVIVSGSIPGFSYADSMQISEL